MDPQVIVDRLLRIVRFDTSVFEEMRDDSAATIPAIAIALVSFLLMGLGGWLWWFAQGYGEKTRIFFESFLVGSVLATALWLAWIGVAYLLLVNVFNYTANLERMVRACSLATVPAALSLLMFIPGFNIGIGIASLALVFLLMDIGVQVSVDAQPGHVIMATFAGFAVFCVVLSVAIQKSDAFAPGVFLFRLPATALADALSRVLLR